jgi:tRNA(His) guanylyltransferase
MDYFRWRQADATRCALNGWCYWTLRSSGESARSATALLDGRSVAYKNELLFQYGINFNELPTWQRRGTGMYWEDYEKPGFDPVREQEVVVKRRRIKVDEELPMKDAYDEFLSRLLDGKTAS